MASRFFTDLPERSALERGATQPTLRTKGAMTSRPAPRAWAVPKTSAPRRVFKPQGKAVRVRHIGNV